MPQQQEQARVFVIAGLGYGDEGKGTTVDWLARRHATGGDVVCVRYNGGAQAAHNVVLPEGTHHTFSQFGSATLAGSKTFLSTHMVVNPLAMLVESDVLAGLPHPISIGDPLARVYIDEARSEARYYINDAFVGRITGDMPNAAACGVRFIITKSVGTTASSASVVNIGGAATY